VGDILGRSKDGFQPVNTDEREGMLGDDSDSEVKQRALSLGCGVAQTVGLVLLLSIANYKGATGMYLLEETERCSPL